jgi:hypothetical protein
VDNVGIQLRQRPIPRNRPRRPLVAPGGPVAPPVEVVVAGVPEEAPNVP